MISRWIIPITGFTQDIGRPNGFDSLWMSLRSFTTAETSIVTPQRWRAKFGQLAAFIDRESSPNPEIIIVAYSWGCGHGFLQLTKELAARGLKVKHAVLNDPVYHSWVRPWRALIFSPEIMIPRTVKEVSWLRQYSNKPRATDLIAEDENVTKIHHPIVLSRNHEYMDDAPAFHELVLKVVAE